MTALSLPRSELPEEIATAIRFLTETCLFANRFNDAALINRNVRNGVEALTAAILSRLGEAEARREEAEAKLARISYVWEQPTNDLHELIEKGLRVEAADAARDAALVRVERLEKRVNAALDDACRMSAILLMAGEMSPQERRTAQAVANGLAAKVRTALTEAGRLAIKDA